MVSLPDEILTAIQQSLFCIRIDVKNHGGLNNSVEIVTNGPSVTEPKWFSDEQGIGKIVEGCNINNTIKIKAIGDGLLKINFRGQDKKFEGKRVPVWIDYKSIKIDGKEQLSKPVSTWHDKPYKIEIFVKNGQEIILEVEQQCHEYTEDELKDVLKKLISLEIYDDIKPYIDIFIKKIDLNNLLYYVSTAKKHISTQHKTIKINFADYGCCDKKNLVITNILKKFYDIEFSEQPDFLFYSCFGIDHLRYKNCVKIFFTPENVLPDFNECDYACGFDYIDFGSRYFRKNYMIPNKTITNRDSINKTYFERKFCNFIYSNATSGEGATLRQEFCKKLMEYKHVDCPGRILNNMSAEDLAPRNGDWLQSKINFLKQYKFTIAFENSSGDGYTTEKLVQPFQSFSVPIYWGNPLVTKDFNPKAFINCNDYNNDFDAVIKRIEELDNDPDKYLAMLRENPMQSDFDFDQGKKFEQWLINIIENGNKPFNKDPHHLSTNNRLQKV